MTEPFVVPFRILVDGQEKQPYTFDGLQTDAALKSRPLVVERSWAHLKTGDYSIEGWKEHVTVERKSLGDLYTTLGQHRDRFEREHERMAAMGAGSSIVVIEASWDQIMNHPPRRSKLLPKTVYRTFLSWSQKYYVPWYCMEDRRLAEVTTFRWLEKWWMHIQEDLAEKSKTCRRCGAPLISKRSIDRGAGHVCSLHGLGKKSADELNSRKGRERESTGLTTRDSANTNGELHGVKGCGFTG